MTNCMTPRLAVLAAILAQKAIALQNTIEVDDIWVKAAPMC